VVLTNVTWWRVRAFNFVLEAFVFWFKIGAIYLACCRGRDPGTGLPNSLGLL